MDNKNKKEMSVDDLVKQLKQVLEISDEEEASVFSDEKNEEAADLSASAPEEAESSPAPENPETISDKVRLLDEFFEAEEKKKDKKKLRAEKKKKKNKIKESSDPDADLKKHFENKPKPDTPKPEVKQQGEFTEEELTSFANEIGDLFSDPEEEKQKAEKPEPAAAQDDRIEMPDDDDDVKKPQTDTPQNNDDLNLEIEQLINGGDLFTDEPDTGEFVPASGKNDVEEDVRVSDDEPFVHNVTEQDGAEDEGSGETKKFNVGSAPDASGAQPGEDEIPYDILGFSTHFTDTYKESEDGYTSSEEAIMDAFGERQEKPEKNPGKSFNDLSVSQIPESDEDDENEKPGDHAPSYDEFISYDQRKTFLDSYKKNYRSLKLSLIFASIFAVLTFLYECLSFFGAKLPYFFSPAQNPAVFILIDLQLFAICSICAVKQLTSGVRAAFSGKASIASLCALSVILTYLYGIIIAILGKPMAHPVMSAAALAVVLMLLSEFRAVQRDTLNFRVISGTPAKPKFVIESYTPGKNSAEEKEFYDYIPENASMLRISKTNFVKGFVASNMKTSSTKKYINLMFPVLALIFAGVLAAVILFRKDVAVAINSAYAASALCMPAAVFAAVTLPSYLCSKRSYSEDSCVISEAAAEEYADASVVTFEDIDVFPPSLDKITSVRLYNESRMDHIMYVLTSLFRKIGGPLLAICENANKEFNEYSNNVVIDNAIENGIEATVDGQKVYLGSSGYMGSKLDPKYCSDDKQYSGNEKSRIMYMVINDVVCAKFYIEYEMDKDFVSMIKQLSTSTRCVAIRTLDPNIDRKLIKSYLDTDIYHCKIMRTRENERRKEVSRKSRGAVVSRNSVKALLRTLMLCDKMVYSSKINMIICFLSVVIGLIFSVFMIITNTFGSLTALHIVGYQLLLFIVIQIITRINI
ncbi:MAG: hypothetical protein J5879_05085 [Clostridia bacterium]|nr:hypothetical protein [Clostridia bacterium]